MSEGSPDSAGVRGSGQCGVMQEGAAPLSKETVSRLLSNYGMFFILLLLCAFFSFATLTESYPEGAAAAEVVAARLDPASELVAAAVSASSSDTAFAARLTMLLEARGIPLAVVSGNPREIRAGLENLLEQQTVPVQILTTSDAYATVSRVKDNVPGLEAVPVSQPPSHTWPTFLKTDNLLNVANQITVMAIVAAGMTMVIITGGIDLSVGSLIALSTVVTAWLIRRSGGVDATTAALIACSLGGIAACACFGSFSGFMITRFELPPFIATLAIMLVARGFAYIISEGRPIYEIPARFTWLGRGTIGFGIPAAVVLMGAIYAIAGLLMSGTRLGRHIYAVGGNPESARLSGIPNRRVLLFVYTLTGALAGLGGVVMASQLRGGAGTYAPMYELYIIAAVVVGGTSLSGGQGRIAGTLIGAFIIAVIQNGMNLTNVESYTQNVVLGFVILGAVLLDRLKQKGFGMRWLRRAVD